MIDFKFYQLLVILIIIVSNKMAICQESIGWGLDRIEHQGAGAAWASIGQILEANQIH